MVDTVDTDCKGPRPDKQAKWPYNTLKNQKPGDRYRTPKVVQFSPRLAPHSYMFVQTPSPIIAVQLQVGPTWRRQIVDSRAWHELIDQSYQQPHSELTCARPVPSQRGIGQVSDPLRFLFLVSFCCWSSKYPQFIPNLFPIFWNLVQSQQPDPDMYPHDVTLSPTFPTKNTATLRVNAKNLKRPSGLSLCIFRFDLISRSDGL
jgi:hypothetical protein